MISELFEVMKPVKDSVESFFYRKKAETTKDVEQRVYDNLYGPNIKPTKCASSAQPIRSNENVSE